MLVFFSAKADLTNSGSIRNMLSDHLFPSNIGTSSSGVTLPRAGSSGRLNEMGGSAGCGNSPKTNGSHQFEMGKMFYGRAVQALISDDKEAMDKHVATAMRWLNQAAGQDHAEANYYLALCHAEFPSSPSSDVSKVIPCLEAASKFGHSLAAFTLAALYYRGQIEGDATNAKITVDKNVSKELSFLHTAADDGNFTDAHYALGVHHYLSPSSSHDNNTILSAKYFTNAQQGGHKQLITMLEAIIKAHSLPVSLLQIVSSAAGGTGGNGAPNIIIHSNKKKQAEKEVNELIQHYLLSSPSLIEQCQAFNELTMLLHLKGIAGITPSQQKTLNGWLLRCDDSLLLLGVVYYEGIGVVKNIEKAKSYFEKAVAQAEDEVFTHLQHESDAPREGSVNALVFAWFALASLLIKERHIYGQEMGKAADLLRYVLETLHGCPWTERYWDCEQMEWHSIFKAADGTIVGKFPQVFVKYDRAIKQRQNENQVIVMRESKQRIDEQTKNGIIKASFAYLQQLKDDASSEDMDKISYGRVLFTIGYCCERKWLSSYDAVVCYESASTEYDDEFALLRVALARLKVDSDAIDSDIKGLFIALSGVNRDVASAIKVLERLAKDKNNSIAQFILGEVFEYGLGEVVVDKGLSTSYFKLAAKFGHSGAAVKLGGKDALKTPTKPPPVVSPLKTHMIVEQAVNEIPMQQQLLEASVEEKKSEVFVEIAQPSNEENETIALTPCVDEENIVDDDVTAEEVPLTVENVSDDIAKLTESILLAEQILSKVQNLSLPGTENNASQSFLPFSKSNDVLELANAILSQTNRVIEMEKQSTVMVDEKIAMVGAQLEDGKSLEIAQIILARVQALTKGIDVAIDVDVQTGSAIDLASAVLTKTNRLIEQSKPSEEKIVELSLDHIKSIDTASDKESIHLAETILSRLRIVSDSIGVPEGNASVNTDNNDPVELATTILNNINGMLCLPKAESKALISKSHEEDVKLAKQILDRVDQMAIGVGLNVGHDLQVSSELRSNVDPISLAASILSRTNALIDKTGNCSSNTLESISSITMAIEILSRVKALTPHVNLKDTRLVDDAITNPIDLATTILAKTNNLLK